MLSRGAISDEEFEDLYEFETRTVAQLEDNFN